ncbi:MAG: hypothetical protein IPN49_14940 [Saprospiraceae bacterium]|nr:hypothetical protein [Saprospiraceae bacterium]MBK9042148.1 hypothetical protein [Saprospiraceae bacterium]
MVKYVLSIIMILSFGLTSLKAQEEKTPESTGMPGDHFSLEGALELFKMSNSPEEFEKLINTKDNEVNNLNLNEDGETDYIRVESKQDGDVHVFILQALVSETERQDIAVIELEKTGDNEANVQIIGDEEIFGEEMILEPTEENGNAEESEIKKGPNVSDKSTDYIVVNVWGWPCVRFVYAPVYRPWISPWRWRVYPVGWKPWRPLAWKAWAPIRVRYHRPGIKIVHNRRFTRANTLYRPARVSSTTVRTRYAGAHANYKVTRTKTKVTGPRGNSVTKKTTTVKGPKGNVRGQKTTVKKSRRG